MRAVVVLVALTACGDNVSGIALEDYGEARRTAECTQLTRCGLFSNTEACERFVLPHIDRDVLAAIDAKKITYDGNAATSCLAALEARACDTTSADGRTSALVGCEKVFIGLVDDGASCAFDNECASGSCDEPACGLNECCSGTCFPTNVESPIDGDCNRDADCSTGFCGTDRRCHARVAVREMCSRYEECDHDLACIGATDLELGRCRDLPLIGEACPYMRCAEIGAWCSNGSCIPVGLAGTPCTSAMECSPYGECNTSGQCAELPVLGEACVLGCSRDAWCDGNACMPLLPDGEPCGAGNQCESLFCEEGPVFDSCVEPETCI
jgi:hypothetical protein